MKKNRTMRVAALLLVLTLMTSCFVGGTFAKYTSGDQGSDMARIAKWGVEVEAENFAMFTTDYATDDDDATFTGDYSVSSATGDRDDVMAPGTKGSFADIAITGTPEVAVDVTIDATVAISDNWMVDHDNDPNTDKVFYCPIIITVGTEAICGLDYTNVGDFVEAIVEEIEDKSEQYAPNTNLAEIYDTTNLDLAWEWVFEESDHDDLNHTHGAGDQTDELDTMLGDLAVTEDLTISIGIKITVEQVD